MKSLLLSTLAAIALTLGLVGGGASGQENKKQDPEPKAEKAAVAGQKLTDESLAAMLEDLGYKVVTEKTPSGAVHRVKITQDNTTYSVEIYVSTNKELIGVDIPLLYLPKDNKIASDRLQKLLTLNDKFSPCHFLVNASSNRIWMCRMFDNRSVTPAVLRAVIDRTMDCAAQSKDAWNVKDWADPIAAQK